MSVLSLEVLLGLPARYAALVEGGCQLRDECCMCMGSGRHRDSALGHIAWREGCIMLIKSQPGLAGDTGRSWGCLLSVESCCAVSWYCSWRHGCACSYNNCLGSHSESWH